MAVEFSLLMLTKNYGERAYIRHISICSSRASHFPQFHCPHLLFSKWPLIRSFAAVRVTSWRLPFQEPESLFRMKGHYGPPGLLKAKLSGIDSTAHSCFLCYYGEYSTEGRRGDMGGTWEDALHLSLSGGLPSSVPSCLLHLLPSPSNDSNR